MLNLKKILIVIIDCYHMHRNRPFYSCKGISYINWWIIPLNKTFFSDNLYHKFGDKCSSLRFYSVFGPTFRLRGKFNGKKIFFSGENIKKRVKHSPLNERVEKVIPFDSRISLYGNNINKYKMDLVLVSCTEGINNAIRFPYWIIAHFDKCYTLSDVQERLKSIEAGFNAVDCSRKGAAAISSHDFFGTRAHVCDAIKDKIDISYAGKWRNNTNLLWDTYKNDKKAFLANYRFNVCPENMDAKDYVTEKIWDSFDAGCIPIYSGALGDPEPKIFNRDAFIMWDFDGDNDNAIKEIEKLNSDDEYYKEMKSRKVFVDGADEYVFSLLQTFYDRVAGLLD